MKVNLFSFLSQVEIAFFEESLYEVIFFLYILIIPLIQLEHLGLVL